MIITKKIGSELIFTKDDGNMVKFDFKTNRCYKKTKDEWREMKSLCKFFQGYTINDIAKEINKSYNYTKNVYYKVKEELKKEYSYN